MLLRFHFCQINAVSGCDSTEPALPLQISSSVAKEHEYTAHGMWIMAEISGRSH